jgi:hypothetical protein
MPKYILLLLILCIHTSAENIDKKKILAIIKAAKQHKSVPSIYKSKTIKKDVASSEESKHIVVYRKRTKPIVYRKRNDDRKITLMKTNYSSLPSIAPSSVELRKRFKLEDKVEEQNTPFFKTPIQTRNKKVNTTARKIKYF